LETKEEGKESKEERMKEGKKFLNAVMDQICYSKTDHFAALKVSSSAFC